MKLLVTGGAGFIGSAVVRQAIADGHEVVNLDALTYAANLANLDGVAGSNRYAFEQADIRDRAALDRIFAAHRPDAVMHLAAESHVDRSIDGPAAFIDTNVVGTCTLLEAARAYWGGHAATSASTTSRPTRSSARSAPTGRFTETTPYAPNSPYSASKAASDHLVRAWGETYGLPVVITNCSNNYGPFHFPEKLIPVVILNALAGREIPVYGAGENVRDWLYVEDHARALLAGRRARADRRELQHRRRRRGDATSTSCARICALMDEMRPDGAPHDAADPLRRRPARARLPLRDRRRRKIRDELGWAPSVTLDEGLRRTVAWYLDNRAWWQAIQARGHKLERLGLKAAQG